MKYHFYKDYKKVPMYIDKQIKNIYPNYNVLQLQDSLINGIQTNNYVMMFVTNNKELFERSRSVHDHGHEYSTEFSRGEEGAIGRGFNFRITELQAAIGIVQLKKLETIINKHRENKKYLKKSLIDNNFPYKFRRHNDPNGEGSDAIFFTVVILGIPS